MSITPEHIDTPSPGVPFSQPHQICKVCGGHNTAEAISCQSCGKALTDIGIDIFEEATEVTLPDVEDLKRRVTNLEAEVKWLKTKFPASPFNA